MLLIIRNNKIEGWLQANEESSMKSYLVEDGYSFKWIEFSDIRQLLNITTPTDLLGIDIRDYEFIINAPQTKENIINDKVDFALDQILTIIGV